MIQVSKRQSACIYFEMQTEEQRAFMQSTPLVLLFRLMIVIFQAYNNLILSPQLNSKNKETIGIIILCLHLRITWKFDYLGS